MVLIDYAIEEEFLTTLLWTGVPDTDLPKRTYLITVVKTDNGEEIYNECFKNIPNDKHAEERMLNDEDFLDAVADHHNVKIILTSNYSPCSKCARKLISFCKKRERKIRKFIIQFPFLFKIQEEENKSGLRSLNEVGVTLRAMNADSWLKVGIDLDFMDVEDKERITERDKKTAYKLKQVLFI